jgi:phosphatidylglycerophosphatase A
LVLSYLLFDIFKPWPIKVVDEHYAGGFGIMIDDVIAGIAAVILHLLQQPITLFFSLCG